jgi:hypothetical protein
LIRDAGPTRISDTEWNDSISPFYYGAGRNSSPGMAGEAAVALQAAPVIYRDYNVVESRTV